MTEKGPSVYVLLGIVLFVLAILSNIYANSFTLESKLITVLDTNSQVITKQILTEPLSRLLLTLFGTFLFALSGSVFITLFVTNRIRASQRLIEEQRLKDLQAAINVDVFDSLFKTLMPEELFSVIKRHIIDSRIVRRDEMWIYDFTSVQTNEIDVQQTIKTKIVNLGHDTFTKDLEIKMFSEVQ